MYGIAIVSPSRPALELIELTLSPFCNVGDGLCTWTAPSSWDAFPLQGDINNLCIPSVNVESLVLLQFSTGL